MCSSPVRNHRVKPSEEVTEANAKYYARRVILALEVLTRNPAPALQYDVKKLKGVKDTYRIRIADI